MLLEGALKIRTKRGVSPVLARSLEASRSSAEMPDLIVPICWMVGMGVGGGTSAGIT